MNPEPRVAADLPDQETMLDAFLSADADFDGIFYTGVRTTGIFCQPSCTARKPLPKNVEFFPSARDALYAGYRPCKRCRPMQAPDHTPEWIEGLLAAVAAEPTRRWRDADLRALGHSPSRVRRWFQRHHAMTFHAYARGLRVGQALGAIRAGEAVTRSALDHGFDSLSGFSAASQRVAGAAPSAAVEVITYRRLDTPLGPMVAGAVESGLCLLEFADRRAIEKQIETLSRRLRRPMAPGQHPLIDQAEAELSAYFADGRRSFEVPLVLNGTDFQGTVWRALMEIPWGTIESYGQLAARIGKPRAVRAVGLANGANRLAIVIPCHRVVGANGRLTGYGGGLWRKRRLLELEGVALPGEAQASLELE